MRQYHFGAVVVADFLELPLVLVVAVGIPRLAFER